MDSKEVIARFEAERQALAMMEHPSIAQVLDAGTTDEGRPYFVMELVKGKPITEYCDKNQLPTKARLELFVQVCNAVQHAHQKGVIHRDLNLPAMTKDGEDEECRLLKLDQALGELEEYDGRKAELVKLRFYAGLSNKQAADALGISAATADRDWSFAKAWLQRAIDS